MNSLPAAIPDRCRQFERTSINEAILLMSLIKERLAQTEAQ
jgi:hypothetical protein